MIDSIKLNHLNQTLSLPVEDILLSYLSDQECQVSLKDEKGKELESKNVPYLESNLVRFAFSFQIDTHYEIEIKNKHESKSIHFTTEPILTSKFIRPANAKLFSPIFFRDFTLSKPIKAAYMFITGLGLYRAFINGIRVGNRYLTPGFNDYDAYLRYQSYDIKDLLGKKNHLEIAMGDGWYKGRIGLDKKPGEDGEVFGDHYLLNATVRILYEDGSKEEILSDTSFQVKAGHSSMNSIYDGEFEDYSKNEEGISGVAYDEKAYNLVADFSAPIVQKDSLKPTLYLSPKGEKILDFHQNMVGFVRIHKKLKLGEKIHLKHGEVLQHECFYNANLRSAKAEATYIGDGKKESYEPMFTFFGFRYVLVESDGEVDPSDFEGVVIYSDLEKTLNCQCSDKKINQLISNTYWGQRGNFVDVPTDCPQRDERMGWTADTQVFTNTACFNMDCYPFYKKYLRDLREDQLRYYQNDFPMYSPSLKGEAGHGGAVWADAGVIIPWNLYMMYGDKKLLETNYPMMKDYLNTLVEKDKSQGNRGLILYGFTFGDWLAQDGVSPQSLMGGTDNGFIMSIYYLYAVRLVHQTANELEKVDDVEALTQLENKIYNAIIDEYFSKNGRFALDTQAAYILALRHHVYINKQRLIDQFKARLKKDFYKMKTGFTGTPILVNTLIENGLVEEAYRILFNEDCPGWLYCINLGATTIWERWNSLLPDGTISGINMNSLNHYSYGSVCEAIYSDIIGLKPTKPGFREVEIAPHPNYRLKQAKLSFKSPHGEIQVGYAIKDDQLEVDVVLPAGVKANLLLPNGESHELIGETKQFLCPVDPKWIYPYDLDTPNADIVLEPKAKEALRRNCPQAYAMITGENNEFLAENGRMIAGLAMFGASQAMVEAYEKELKAIRK